MCGIVGIVSKSNCLDQVINGLYSLEYRGYDSSGVAFLIDDKFFAKRCVGKISSLEKTLSKENLNSKIAIGHTRWATHGKPELKNCHPFLKNNCALVHNGIIENFEELIKHYSISNINIKSDTDSEIIAEIYNKLLKKYNDPVQAIENLNSTIEGTFSFAFLVKNDAPQQ